MAWEYPWGIHTWKVMGFPIWYGKTNGYRNIHVVWENPWVWKNSWGYGKTHGGPNVALDKRCSPPNGLQSYVTVRPASKLVGLASFSQTDQFHEAKWSSLFGFWSQTVQTIWLQKLVSPASWSQTDQPNEAGLTTDQPPEAGLTSFEACLTVTHDWMCDLGL